MQDLIKRLEQAEEGSRELDVRFYDAMTGNTARQTPSGMDWVQADLIHTVPHYTTNLQDAVDVIPEGVECWMVSTPVSGGSWARIWEREYGTEMGACHLSAKDQHALALCIAILKILE